MCVGGLGGWSFGRTLFWRSRDGEDPRHTWRDILQMLTLELGGGGLLSSSPRIRSVSEVLKVWYGEAAPRHLSAPNTQILTGHSGLGDKMVDKVRRVKAGKEVTTVTARTTAPAMPNGRGPRSESSRRGVEDRHSRRRSSRGDDTTVRTGGSSLHMTGCHCWPIYDGGDFACPSLCDPGLGSIGLQAAGCKLQTASILHRAVRLGHVARVPLPSNSEAVFSGSLRAELSSCEANSR
jgi:hypothetical protein